ncbi:hypothetical protein GGX14DRAFT_401250 [Mycena pura]|uniref:Uncharacterized protein n=1 Tax=Mycena pura TaxID=153505 RepID=A0AAD6V0C9_9AGAR|nr:hypothetical protein GGX14DRAFT_401250 [Mycena pura]
MSTLLIYLVESTEKSTSRQKLAASETAKQPPLLVVANRCRKTSADIAIARRRDARQVGQNRGTKGVSAKTNEGVKEVMQRLLVNTSAADTTNIGKKSKEVGLDGGRDCGGSFEWEEKSTTIYVYL